MNAVDRLLSRLDGVNDNGHGRWMARCPAHNDRSPSLSIRGVDDGTILLHCFAGCSATDVVEAVGLELRDLFSAPVSHRRPAKREHTVPAYKVLQSVSHALTVVGLADSDLRHGKPLNDEDYKAVENALAVLNQARRDAA